MEDFLHRVHFEERGHIARYENNKTVTEYMLLFSSINTSINSTVLCKYGFQIWILPTCITRSIVELLLFGYACMLVFSWY